jgi:phage tail-like protein
MAEERSRLIGSLPAIYRVKDASQDLRHLLSVFEEVMFSCADPAAPGIEQQIEAIPSCFAPLGIATAGGDESARAPDRFLPWLAGWVAFAPHALFTPEQLRKIVAGITPLYARRGTRAYLEAVLKLCFDEVQAVEIDEQPDVGFRVGRARIGVDSLSADGRPFWFRVAIEVEESSSRPDETPASQHELEQRVRAIVEFAKPAHTEYDLELRYSKGAEYTRTIARAT